MKKIELSRNTLTTLPLGWSIRQPTQEERISDLREELAKLESASAEESRRSEGPEEPPGEP